MEAEVSDCPDNKIVVIKLGGSVLATQESYRSAARFLVRRLHKCFAQRFVVVVSAQNGQTDELEGIARRITKYPSQRVLDLLWSTGELRSVALLTLHLEKLGVPAVGLNVHETGLRLQGVSAEESSGIELSHHLQNAFEGFAVAVVPGFFATLMGGTIVSLGRGGSDLSAVLLAEKLQTGQCELVKDVGGYFSEDPNLSARAEHLPFISYEKALEMAARGCELVQPRAIQAAREAGLRLVISALGHNAPVSVVSEDGRRGCGSASINETTAGSLSSASLTASS
jgi:aspartate kinase